MDTPRLSTVHLTHLTQMYSPISTCRGMPDIIWGCAKYDMLFMELEEGSLGREGGEGRGPAICIGH